MKWTKKNCQVQFVCLGTQHCKASRNHLSWKTIWSNFRCGWLGRRLFSLAWMVKVLAAEKSWLSPVAQHLYADEDGYIPSAVARKMLLSSCSRNSEKWVPEWFNLPRYHTQKGWNRRRGEGNAIGVMCNAIFMLQDKDGILEPTCIVSPLGDSVATKGPWAIADLG